MRGWKWKCILCESIRYLSQAEVSGPAEKAERDDKEAASTIVYATVGRAQYAFDVYSIPAADAVEADAEVKLTDGQSLNFNGAFGRCPLCSFTDSDAVPMICFA